MMLAALGYVIADVAADGLTVQFARREPVAVRGQTQTTVYLVRTLGQIVAVTVTGFGMNGPEYNGSFKSGISFQTVMFIFFVPALVMIPVSWYGITEPQVDSRPSLRRYLDQLWTLLESKAMFFVVIYQFFTPMVGNISTTAGGAVKKYWAEVEQLQNALFSLVGLALFALGLWLVKKYFLNYSWRGMLLITTIVLNCIDMIFVYCTVYDVVRNQYFYLGETVLVEIPAAANFVVATFYIVEMSDSHNEGLVYGLLTTIHNLGSPFARAIANQLYVAFTPSLSDSTNYIEDTSEFRTTVANSFTLSYFFAFIAMVFVILLPSQKEEAQKRKKEWGGNVIFARLTVTVLSMAFVYSVTINMLAMDERTMCLKIAGGDGC